MLGEPERKRIPTGTKELLFAKQKGKCNYCGNKFTIQYFHIDHKTPVARRGSNNPSNLQLLCGPCNTRKGNKTDGEFRRAYKLAGSRTAKNPPSRPLSQNRFEKISKEISKKKAIKRKKDNDLWSW